MRQIYIREVALVALAVLVTHALASFFSLYWYFWWLDVLLHYLGGAWVTGAFLWLIFFSGYTPRRVFFPERSFLLAIVVGISVGIFWEGYEFLFGVTYGLEGYAVDTFVDLLMDMAGALSAYLHFLMTKMPTLTVSKE